MRINDRVFGMLMLIIAVAYGYEATQFPIPFGGQESVGPETFPIMLSLLLGVSSIYMILRPDPDEKWAPSAMLIELGIVVLSLLAFAWAIEPVGFMPAAALVVSFLSWRMGASITKSLITGVSSSVVIFFLFNNVLELALPLGLLEF
ncbi:tripartite tricarboxylate transporter TctB family protein [Marinomonas colpomeniae]|uniref:Tripartite tricarboxylate transporter TctB family protein n=1 Tax=Marinomonas colpomeniae TaxID=2774408 RepID=A0ABR8P033_9GAMM|nr:tripartite tricarboxylate transporter TctB family protein [Marinomonas colpomeniae]MBD5771650.1 tripartite tricarboxylate transporter TctB family protein [Marinomonas colpomeniae]